MWNPIQKMADVPTDRDIRLAVLEKNEVHSLAFPCRRSGHSWIHAESRRLIDGGSIDASGGSRHSYPALVFFPDVYSILYRHHLALHPTLWSAQLAALQHQFATLERRPPTALDVNAYTLVSDEAVGLLDYVTSAAP